MWYNNRMTTDSWINLVAAILVGGGTLALAVMTWKSIRQTRQIYEKEQEQRLLDEIIEWAEESAKSAIYRQTLNKHELWKAILNYKYCAAKGEYIRAIAATAFLTLTSQVNDVITKLNEATVATTNLRESKSDKNHKKMRNCEDGVTNTVQELFKESAKIKTKRPSGEQQNLP